MVRKSTEKRRMCVDFTYMNNACPPNIDASVNSALECALLSFLDAWVQPNKDAYDG